MENEIRLNVEELASSVLLRARRPCLLIPRIRQIPREQRTPKEALSPKGDIIIERAVRRVDWARRSQRPVRRPYFERASQPPKPSSGG